MDAKILYISTSKPTFSILHSHFYKIPTSVCLLYIFIQIKYSKPFVSWVSYAKLINIPINPPIKIPATINPINTHGSIPIKTHYQPNQNPSYCRFAGPTHQVPKSFATASFLSVVRSGLPIDLNEPPPCVVLFGSRVSWVLYVVVLESSELL